MTKHSVLPFVLMIWVLGSPAIARSQTQALSMPSDAHLQVYHLIIGPGQTVTTQFGHNALRIRNTRTGRDVVYNWGAIEEGVIRNLGALFQRKLVVSLEVGAWQATYAHYREQNRRIQLQRLDLPAGTASDLLYRLNKNILPENKYYVYDIFDDNCSTRLRNMLDEVLAGEISRQASSPQSLETQRQHLHRVTGSSSFTDLIFSLVVIGLNKRMDQQLTDGFSAQFLPYDVAELLADTQLQHPDGRSIPLVDDDFVLYEAETAIAQMFPAWSWVIFFIMLTPHLLLMLDRKRQQLWASVGIFSWGLLSGILGIAMLLIVFWALPGSRLEGNLAFFTPLHLFLLPLAWRLGTGKLELIGTVSLGLLLTLTTVIPFIRLFIVYADLTRQENAEIGIFTIVISIACLMSWRTVQGTSR